ncbi:fungal-specific transcription factor domain-containing protein [Mycena rebaudengoi]|nr:fungal-specific transcription factor domain-containing protein [Mycena rebaudengoi]
MPSNEEEYAEDFTQNRSRTRRVQRACDTCRRRKSRCNGSPGTRCATCLYGGLECTYIIEATKRPRRKSNYVVQLESRLEQAEASVRRLRGGMTSSALEILDNPDKLPAYAYLKLTQHAVRALVRPQPPPQPEDLLHTEISRRLESLTIDARSDNTHRRFIGKSSGVALVHAAVDYKEAYAKDERRARSPCPKAPADEERPWASLRMQYWQYVPWSVPGPLLVVPQPLRFPPQPLLERLVDAYFTHMNVFLPLLHRPTFERAIREGLHLQGNAGGGTPGGSGQTFGATVLLVCAIGSRYEKDGYSAAAHEARYAGGGDEDRPRERVSELACGWEWFNQVPLKGNHVFAKATLYDLQYYCLALLFLEGAAAPQAVWTLVGLGLRLAQDVGVHRRKNIVERPTVEGELWKRAFWVLLYMDRMISSGMGRSCAIQFDEFDLEPPIECDDDYWEDPYHPFEQPEGLPSKIAFFNTLMRLNHILAFSLKALYSLTKLRVALGIDANWEESIVTELDSVLNQWRDEIPEHLRWDPDRQDPVFFYQSVALHCAHCQLQILIHRPFIPMVRKSAPMAFPSLAICTSAARACANMVDIQRQRKGNVPAFFNLQSVFSAGIILLLNVWSGQRTGLMPDPTREMANVHKCMEVIKLCEDRWQSAGLFWDILSELASVGQLPLAGQSTQAADPGKRPRAPHPRCSAEPIPEGIAFSSRGPNQTSLESTISDLHYAPSPQSFSGQIGDEDVGFGASSMAPMFAPPPPSEAWFAPEDPFASHGGAPGGSVVDEMMSLIDRDTIAMWTNAPTGIEVDDWGTYFSSFSEITQGQQMHGEFGSNGS